jgi:hypothetical protein
MSALDNILKNKVTGGNTPGTITRFSGGIKELHPLITGYWIFLIKAPNMLGGTSGAGGDAFTKWFLTTAEGFTPPSRTLNKVDVPGQGGLASSFVSGQMLNRTFSTTHREYSGMRMTKLVNAWTNVMDESLGVFPKGGTDSTEFTAKSYKGSAYVALLKPQVAKDEGKLTKDDIEYAYHFDGVWPEVDPTEAMNSDISGNDTVQVNVTWNFDGWPRTTTNQLVDVVEAEVEAQLGDTNSTLGSGLSATPSA